MADIQLFFEKDNGHLMLLEGNFRVDFKQDTHTDTWSPFRDEFGPLQLTAGALTVTLTHQLDNYTVTDLGPKEDYEYGMA